MNIIKKENPLCSPAFREFFKSHHDKLLCTANERGEPSVALMGTPRLTEEGDIELALSDDPSVTLNNLLKNQSAVFLVYEPALRARDYEGLRIYVEATEILLEGERFQFVKGKLRERFGDKKADALVALVTFRITKLRPVIDRGQSWNEAPFEEMDAEETI